MIRFFIIGFIFGLALIKGEAISWFRMQDMFHFRDFQIFGIFLTAIPTAAFGFYLLKKSKLKSVNGIEIKPVKKKLNRGTIYGSALFGIGWGLTGACPGPIFVQIGNGYLISIVLLICALAGTWFYSYFRERLPH